MNIPKKFALYSAAGLLLVATAGATGTLAFAQANTSPANAFITDLAQKLGISQQKLTIALQQTADDQINGLLASGKITKQEAKNMKEKVTDGQFGAFWMHGGEEGKLNLIASLAAYLNMNTSDLMRSLHSGQTMSDIITSKGKTVDGAKTYLTDQATAHIQQEVSSGELTQSQATTLTNSAQTRITNFLNGQFPMHSMERGMM